MTWEGDAFALTYILSPTTYPATVEIIKQTFTARTEESPLNMQGTIHNPYGTTSITNDRGDILQIVDTAQGWIHTNNLTLEAKRGSIGDGRDVNVEMVQYQNALLQTVAPKLSVEAGDDIHLALGARRYKPDAQDVTTAITKMKAGGLIDILLNGSSDIERKENQPADKPTKGEWEWVVTAGPASVYNFTLLQNGNAKDIVVECANQETSGGANTWISVLGKMNLALSGKLYVRITGNVDLHETAGSIWVGEAKSTRGPVILRAVNDITVAGPFLAPTGLQSALYVDYQDTDATSNTATFDNLEGVNATIVVYGAGSSDTLVINDSNDPDNEDGALKNTAVAGNVTLTTLTGFGMNPYAGISIDRFGGAIETVNIFLGSGVNTLTIRGTTATTNLNMGAGSDTLDAGPGATEGAAGVTGKITPTQITGMGGVINYTYTGKSVETLIVTLGSGDDLFTVQNTPDNTPTTVHGGAGNNTLVVETTTSNLTVYGGRFGLYHRQELRRNYRPQRRQSRRQRQQ